MYVNVCRQILHSSKEGLASLKISTKKKDQGPANKKFYSNEINNCYRILNHDKLTASTEYKIIMIN